MFQCWSYYLEEANTEMIKPLPSANKYEKVDMESFTEIRVGEYGIIENLSIPSILPTYSYRLPNMGIYEAYYAVELHGGEYCLNSQFAENIKECCDGENYNCGTAGALFLYNSKTKTTKIINLYHYLYSFHHNISYWRYFYIANDSTIMLYDGLYENKTQKLSYITQVAISANGNIETISKKME